MSRQKREMRNETGDMRKNDSMLRPKAQGPMTHGPTDQKFSRGMQKGGHSLIGPWQMGNPD